MTYQLHCCECSPVGEAEDADTATRLSARHTSETGHAVIAIDAVATTGEVGRLPHALDAGAPRADGSAAGLATTAATIEEQTLDTVDQAIDKAAVITAIREAVARHGRRISPNHIRPLIPPTVFHKTVGRTYHELIAVGALIDTDLTDRSDDHPGGNAGKRIPIYDVVPELLP